MTEGELKLGIYEKALPPELDWPARLALAGRLGFQFVEMSIDESDERLARLDWERAERTAFVNAVADSPLGVPSMCLSGHRRFPLGSRDPVVRARAREIMDRAILLAADTGIRTVQLAGYDVYYEQGDRDTRAWFLDGLRTGLRRAARENVMLSMEIMDSPLMSSIVRYLNWDRQLHSPWLTVYPDVGNLSAWGNDVLEELELGFDKISAIHLKETLAVAPGFPGKFKEVPFGTGCVDFSAVFRKLAELGYAGPFLIEMWTGKGGNAEAEVAAARAWILARMREAGFID